MERSRAGPGLPLAFSGVSFTYPGDDHEVARDVNLTVAPGTVTAILGPNGAGKTTLLHLALGWLTPRSGRITLGGRPLAEWGRRELGREMALVPQRERSTFEHTVLDMVLLGRVPHLGLLEMPGEADLAVAFKAMATCGLTPHSERPVTCMSGGEQQLVLLARALAQEPRILLMDEPFSHLDIANKSRLLRVMRTLVREGVTIVLTVHEPEIAAAVATDLVLMREGRVWRTGPLAEVMTAEALSETYGIPVEVRRMDGRSLVLWW